MSAQGERSHVGSRKNRRSCPNSTVHLGPRSLSDWVESESGLDVDTWSHFPRKTGIHFSGKCSSLARPRGQCVAVALQATSAATLVCNGFSLSNTSVTTETMRQT